MYLAVGSVAFFFQYLIIFLFYAWGQDSLTFEFMMPDLYDIGLLYRWQGTTHLCQVIIETHRLISFQVPVEQNSPFIVY
jgi:hypothetical protein